MFEREVYSGVFIRASEIVGGREALAAQLGVPLEVLESWASGEVQPPPEMFLRAVDIHVEASLKGLLSSVSQRRAGETPTGGAS